jgi:hypothetical protein
MNEISMDLENMSYEKKAITPFIYVTNHTFFS